ncbi:MAG: ribonuclease H-like domain-containing protein, partial [Synergistaceae bacterium]|nr:ribonuclease H-like domain-containing protein [Synergistaceae bacterium]
MGKFDRFFEDDRSPPRRGNSENPGGAPDDVRGLPAGEWLRRGVYKMERFYKIGCKYGRGSLGNPDEMEVMGHLGASGDVVFLDLETTGLSGGAGTYAFLCGLGRVFGGRFKVTQYFLKSPAYEPQWLDAIDADIPAGSTIATYNGKNFDVPMLMTRHVLSRMNVHWQSYPHIDLLHLSRRFYRGYLESCSLGSVERSVLGVVRSGEDVPGCLIPQLYLRYLRER